MAAQPAREGAARAGFLPGPSWGEARGGQQWNVHSSAPLTSASTRALKEPSVLGTEPQALVLNDTPVFIFHLLILRKGAAKTPRLGCNLPPPCLSFQRAGLPGLTTAA